MFTLLVRMGYRCFEVFRIEGFVVYAIANELYTIIARLLSLVGIYVCGDLFIIFNKVWIGGLGDWGFGKS
jgi:hypothetical protein